MGFVFTTLVLHSENFHITWLEMGVLCGLTCNLTNNTSIKNNNNNYDSNKKLIIKNSYGIIRRYPCSGIGTSLELK